MKNRTLGVGAQLLITLWALSACTNPLTPFEPQLVDRAKDQTAPFVEITSPGADSVYGQSVEIQGSLSDNGLVMPTLRYEVSDLLGSRILTGTVTTIPAAASEGISGSFSFSFSTSDFSSDIRVSLIAEDWNGNESSAETLRLVYSGNTIPSFSVEPGNKQVALSWEPVDGASGYRIYYTTDGSYPGENYGEATPLLSQTYGRDAPYTINGLENGDVCVFLLMAVSDDESRSWYSDYRVTIPLSKLTLAPNAYSESGQVYLEWPHILDEYSYQVFRRREGEAESVNISGNISNASFVDRGVVNGEYYFYSVKPALPGTCLSSETASCSFPLISGSDRGLADYAVGSGITDTALCGDTLWLVDKYANLYAYDVSDPSDPRSLGFWDSGFANPLLDATVQASDKGVYISYGEHIYVRSVTQPEEMIDILSLEGHVSDTLFRNGTLYFVLGVHGDNPAEEGIYAWGVDSQGCLNANPSAFTPYDFYLGGTLAMEQTGTGHLYLTYRDNSYSDPSEILSIQPGGDFYPYPLYPNQSGQICFGAVPASGQGYAVAFYDDSENTSMMIRETESGEQYGTTSWTLEDRGFVDGYIDGDLMFLLQRAFLRVYRITGVDTAASVTPEAAITEVYTVPLSGNGISIEAGAGVTYCGTDRGFLVVDTAEKVPSEIPYRGLSSVRGVDVRGPLVYVARSSLEPALTAYDFSDPASPVERGTTADTLPAVEIQIHGDYAFIFCTGVDQGIHVYDISDPDDIGTASGYYETESGIGGAFRYGQYLYLYSNGFLEILDISDPEQLYRVNRRRLSTYDDGDTAVIGARLYVGYDNASNGAIHIYSLEDLADPSEIRSDTIINYIDELVPVRGKLYTYNKSEELVVIDLDDPEYPIGSLMIEQINPAQVIPFSGLDAAGDYLFFHGWSDGDSLEPGDGLYTYNTYNDIEYRVEVLGPELYGGSSPADEGRITLSGRYLYIGAGELICVDLCPGM